MASRSKANRRRAKLTVEILLDRECEELAERISFGDDESVWAFFAHHYPKAMSQIVEAGGDWREFVTAVREVYR